MYWYIKETFILHKDIITLHPIEDLTSRERVKRKIKFVPS